MELQQLLLGRDYLQRAAVASPRTAGYVELARASVDTADVVRSADRVASSSVVAGLDCHRSSLHDVLLLRQRHQHHNPASGMQYPPSQHPLPAAAAAAIRLGTPGTSPYYSPYYQRPSSTSQHYLSPSQCFPDGSRHNLDSLAVAGMQPGGFSYEHHAALLRDSAVTRLAVADSVQSSARNDPASRLGVELTTYCTDRRCAPTPLHDCLPVAGPLGLSSSRYYMTGGRHLQCSTSNVSSQTAAAGAGAFMRYLRPPVSTENFSGDCVCQWLEPVNITQQLKLEVSLAPSLVCTQYTHIMLVDDQIKGAAIYSVSQKNPPKVFWHFLDRNV